MRWHHHHMHGPDLNSQHFRGPSAYGVRSRGRDGQYLLTMPDTYPAPSSAAVTAVMRGNRKRDTLPELAIRSALHRDGLRFRKHQRVAGVDRTVEVDVCFPRHRLALFIDGCFWHGCPEHGNIPKTNSAYWAPKLDRNRARDRTVDEALSDAGWLVIRVWEHESAESVVSRVRYTLEQSARAVEDPAGA